VTDRALVPTLVLLLAAGSLGGCVVAAVGAAGAGGGYALSQERSLSDTAHDAGIHAALSQSWHQYNVKLADDLDSTVYEGRVLVTGTVPSEDWHQEAIKRAWQTDGVKEVYDQIQLSPSEGFMQDMSDTTISSKLKADLVADGDVKSINYTVTTVKGVVYVMGSARSQAELNRVIDYARNIANVKNVVSYVQIRTGEPPKAATASTVPPPPAPAASPAQPPPPAPASPAPAPGPPTAITVTPLK